MRGLLTVLLISGMAWGQAAEASKPGDTSGPPARSDDAHFSQNQGEVGHPTNTTQAQTAAPDPNTRWALEELQRRFGTKVLLRENRPGHPGQLIFEWYDANDLTRLYEQLMRQ